MCGLKNTASTSHINRAVHLMERSHLRVKPSRKSREWRFLRSGVGRGYLVAVTGSTWLLRDVRGNYRMYVAVMGYYIRGDLPVSATL